MHFYKIKWNVRGGYYTLMGIDTKRSIILNLNITNFTMLIYKALKRYQDLMQLKYSHIWRAFI